MWKYSVLVILIFPMFTLQTTQPPTSSTTSINTQNFNKATTKPANTYCSRPHSKVVREYFARVLVPIYQKYSQPVPNKCPFSPFHDLYHYQENNKTKLDTNRWRCEICGKSFFSEKYIDKHFEKKHENSLIRGKTSNCLAHYCRIFRCDLLMHQRASSTKCYETTLTNLRERCKTYLEGCIPRDAPYQIRNKISNELRENLCQFLTCTKYNQLPPYMSAAPNFFLIFGIVFLLVVSLIVFGVINHTNLIYDENEVVEHTEEQGDITTQNSMSSRSSRFDDLLHNNQNQLRHRNTLAKH